MRPLHAVRRARARGQTLVLGVVTLLVLALVVMMTFNITVAVHQKIKVQNYADAKAFSLAVAEARALNYFAYTNRAIANAYVGMANVHAYMSEAAMLVDLKIAMSGVMGQIAAIETAQCYCCCTPIGCGPCCFTHCYHSFEAGLNGAFLAIDWITGKMGNRVQKLDKPARDVMSALHTHIDSIHLSQNAVKLSMVALLGTGDIGKIKEGSMQGAKSETNDEALVAVKNLAAWNDLFNNTTAVKKKVMAETVNATRQPFAWNRDGSPAAQAVLFPPMWVSDNAKGETFWMGPKPNCLITQTPDTGFNAGGRTGITDGDFPWQWGGMAIMSKDVDPGTVTGKAVYSFDWGTLLCQWRDGGGVGQLPMLGAVGPGELMSGESNRHRADLGIIDFFNRPHSGAAHSTRNRMERFLEFAPESSWPFNQPAVYAAANTDSRVNEYGIKGPWKVTSDDSGEVKLDVVEGQTASLTLTNKQRTKAFSKAMVYYHRIGDWADHPNFFNPYWRAKLHPMKPSELPLALGAVDTDALQVTLGVSAMGRDKARGVNVAR